MKNLIKFTLVALALTFMFIKVYAPLMYEKEEVRTIDLAIQNFSLNKKITSDKAELYQNSPDPFDSSTKIRLSIPKHARTYETNFDGKDFSTGVYFYKMETDDYTEIKKMTFNKVNNKIFKLYKSFKKIKINHV